MRQVHLLPLLLSALLCAPLSSSQSTLSASTSTLPQPAAPQTEPASASLHPNIHRLPPLFAILAKGTAPLHCPDPPFKNWTLFMPEGGVVVANGTNQAPGEDFYCLAPGQLVSLRWEVQKAGEGQNETANGPIHVSIGDYRMKHPTVQPGVFCPTARNVSFHFDAANLKPGSRVALALRSRGSTTLAYAKEMFIAQKECKSKPGSKPPPIVLEQPKYTVLTTLVQQPTL